MRKPSEIADRYIGRNGERIDRTPVEKADQFVSDLVAVSIFLGWQDDNAMSGGVKAVDAFNAFARLVNLPAPQLRRVVRGDE